MTLTNDKQMLTLCITKDMQNLRVKTIQSCFSHWLTLRFCFCPQSLFNLWPSLQQPLTAAEYTHTPDYDQLIRLHTHRHTCTVPFKKTKRSTKWHKHKQLSFLVSTAQSGSRPLISAVTSTWSNAVYLLWIRETTKQTLSFLAAFPLSHHTLVGTWWGLTRLKFNEGRVCTFIEGYTWMQY